MEHREIILKSLKPIIAWLHILFLVAIQGVVLGFFSTVKEAFVGIFNLGFKVSSLHISPGFFLTVIFVIYGALLTSKAIQALLLKKILPHYGAEKGVQLSITRLVHYGILTIGFLIMLRFLGFELNQLTLLGGALGVGIGFGLQAIVNNFASGLILLFERPIKVGDTIQIGTEIGEVKHLGLRATIIQTFDNAEIVVPNSDLITGQVTNWTLGERKVRIRVPVGVAYGTDVAKVLKILLACAEANPMVLDTPKPVSFFLAFGASSLDFELRVWIPEFLNKTQVLSDLNQDIENEFALNNIEIPFPQTDLHLRSVDEGAAARIWRSSTHQQPAPTGSSAPENGEENDKIGAVTKDLAGVVL
jgi:small-conductance mechanosensitive channel